MANKHISQLPAASTLRSSDLLVAEQNGVAKSVTGSVLLAMLDGHGGIASTSYTAPVAPSLQGTLTLTFADGTTASIPIYNGAQGAQGAQGEQGEQGAAFTYEDFTSEQLESLRGEQGIQGNPGNPGYVHIKWSSVEPTSDADIGDTPDAWIGIYSGSSATAPTNYSSYAWCKIKGETGERGLTGARGANGTKIYLSNSAPILYDYYYYFALSQIVSPDGQIGVSPASGDLIIYRNSYYSSTGITDSLRGVKCTWGYDIVLNTATDEQVQDAVDEYLDNHPTVTGTFTNAAKRALIALLEKVAYTIADGQDYLDALENELSVPVVTSISAVFTQGSAVIYDTDSLDTLKQYLVVTATYFDSSTEVLADSVYTLSGTLTAGTSTITVSYGGKTTTFNATVTSWDINWDYTMGSPETAGLAVTLSGASGSKESATMQSDGLNVDAQSGSVTIARTTNFTANHGVAEFDLTFLHISSTYQGLFIGMSDGTHGARMRIYNNKITFGYSVTNDEAHTEDIYTGISVGTPYLIRFEWDTGSGFSLSINGSIVYTLSHSLDSVVSRLVMTATGNGDGKRTNCILRSYRAKAVS